MQEPPSTERDRPDRLKRDLQAIAHALGFAAVRVAPAGPAPHADRFLDWIADCCHGDMDWLARAPERRTDPAHVLPGVESVGGISGLPLGKFKFSPDGSSQITSTSGCRVTSTFPAIDP